MYSTWICLFQLYLRHLNFFPRKYFFDSMKQDIMCAIALWLRAFFCSRTLPKTMITIKASQAMFLFSYVFCSLSSIIFLENSTVPQCMTTLTQNARWKLRLILCLTSYLVVCCKTLVVFGLTGSSFFLP